MAKTLTFSAGARAKISDFLDENAGVHMPTISQIERAIAERLNPVLEHAIRSDITGASVTYRSSSPMSGSYRYQVRGLSLRATVRSRSIDLADIRVEKLYPKTRERIDVAMTPEMEGRISARILENAMSGAERACRALGVAIPTDRQIAA